MNQERSLSFEKRGKEYALVKSDSGLKSEIALSEEDMLFLPKILQESLNDIIVDGSDINMVKHGAKAVAAVPIVNLQLNINTARTEILLTLIDKFGNSSSFAIPS